jgi:hypothetical protein
MIYRIEDEGDHRSSCLYISFRDPDGPWTTPVLLEPGGKPIHGMCPVLAPDGKYLFFNYWSQMTNDIYWVEIESVIDSLRKSHLAQ